MGAGKHDKGKCHDVFALLSEYLDRELTPQTCAEIEAHLAGCPPCIEFLNSLKRTVRLCRDCGGGEKPRPLTAEQRDKLVSAYRAFLAGNRG
ncbi:MAG: zf-HC2 domain-containing protein [Bryobacteraceae bacterium]|jgi:RNA polymerase sigma-70 factor (ECF subfamily)